MVVTTAAAIWSVYRGVLTILILSSLSSGDYVQRGSDITDCSMKCPHTDGFLELYRVCGENRSSLLKLTCNDTQVHNHYEPRLHLNTSSGCWTLTDVGKDDSCVYNVVYYANGTRTLRTLPITVLGVLTILILSSLSSGDYVQRGSDITDCSMKCPHTDVILELYRVCGENRSSLLKLTCNDTQVHNHYEPRLHLNTSSGCWTLTDPGKDDSCPASSWCSSSPGGCAVVVAVVVTPLLIIIVLSVMTCWEMKRTGEKNFFTAMRGLLKRLQKTLWKNREYEQTAQREGGTEMMDIVPV